MVQKCMYTSHTHSRVCTRAQQPHPEGTHKNHGTEAGHTPQVLLNPIIFQSGALLTLIIFRRESRPSLGAFLGGDVSQLDTL